MSALPIPDLARQYVSWLNDRMLTVERGSMQVLSTPFLDPFHDGIEIYVDGTGGEILLHDNGRTLDNLMDMGVQIEKSERRQQIIQHAIAGCGVEWRNGRLQTVVTPGSVPQRAHFLLTAISRLNDLWMSATPRTAGDFFAIVKEYFDEHDVRYVANVQIPGRTVDHPMDFVISLPRGKDRLVKLMASPTVQAAKLVSFTWMEIQGTRPESQRLVVVNDIPSGETSGADDDEPPTRHISDQSQAILQAYSHTVLKWSDASNDDVFLRAVQKV